MSAATPRPRSNLVLLLALLALSALYAAWMLSQRHLAATLVVFVLPPLLLAIGVWRQNRHAAYWAGVLALGWFSHGVMVAWSRPPERLQGWIELALAVTVVFAANLPGIQARFGRKS